MNVLIASLFIAASLQAQVLSETVGEVGGEVFTSRQSRLSGLLEKVLDGARDSGPAMDSKSDRFRDEVSSLLLEVAVSKESETFSLGQVSDPEVATEVSKLRRATQARADWRRFDYTEAELTAAVRRKLTARHLIRFRSESMKAVISDAEAQKYFEKNRSRFGNLPFENFQEQIKRVLSQQQLDERLRAWFEILRRKFQVRDYFQRPSLEGSAEPARS